MSTITNEPTIEKVADAISTLGVGHKKASVLAYLIRHKKATQHEIERAMDLRQPEVSSYLKEFKIHRWITAGQQEKLDNKRGRTANIYTLSKDPSIIAKELRDLFINKTQIDESVKLISKVKG